MSKSVAISEGKNNFTKLLKDIKEDIIIKNRNIPVAVILPYSEYVKIKRLRSYAKMVEISDKLSKKGIHAMKLYETSKKEMHNLP